MIDNDVINDVLYKCIYVVYDWVNEVDMWRRTNISTQLYPRLKRIFKKADPRYLYHVVRTTTAIREDESIFIGFQERQNPMSSMRIYGPIHLRYNYNQLHDIFDTEGLMIDPKVQEIYETHHVVCDFCDIANKTCKVDISGRFSVQCIFCGRVDTFLVWSKDYGNHVVRRDQFVALFGDDIFDRFIELPITI